MGSAGAAHSIGSIVQVRGRDWVITANDGETLRLKPLSGGEEEGSAIHLGVEGALVKSASFPAPSPDQSSDLIAGKLLRDAARLALRSGAGPFRSMGRLSVRPRPYQFVPLIMALKPDSARLLIADDVGIGKTIEAGLIAGELLSRGDAKRICVLCPPHLCDQWQEELREKFHIYAEIVRSSTIAKLDRSTPHGRSLYQYFPHLIISIDFAKSDRHKPLLLEHCPDLVIVDEAHTAADPGHTGSSDQQQRHALLREIAKDQSKHLLLLTATPHSGVEASFQSLLGLLDPNSSPSTCRNQTKPNDGTLQSILSSDAVETLMRSGSDRVIRSAHSPNASLRLKIPTASARNMERFSMMSWLSPGRRLKRPAYLRRVSGPVTGQPCPYFVA